MDTLKCFASTEKTNYTEFCEVLYQEFSHSEAYDVVPGAKETIQQLGESTITHPHTYMRPVRVVVAAVAMMKLFIPFVYV